MIRFSKERGRYRCRRFKSDLPAPYFLTWKLGRLKVFATLVVAVIVVIGAGYARVQAPGENIPRPLLGQRIVVDPGHGGIDPGCHRDDTYEKEIVLQIAAHLSEILRELGADVFVTRESDIELSHLTDSESTRHRRDLAARVLLAKEHDATLLLSLHVNSAGSSSMGGAMIFYHPGSQEGRRVGEHILSELRTVVPGNQNSVLSANYYILRNAPMTAVLVETGFISNPTDRALLESDEGRRRIANAIANGLVAAFDRDALDHPSILPSDSSLHSQAAWAKDSDDHPCLGEPE